MIVEQAVNRFGRIDSLINNAGIFISKPFTDDTLKDYLAITAENLTGFFHVTQGAHKDIWKSRPSLGMPDRLRSTVSECAPQRIAEKTLPQPRDFHSATDDQRQFWLPSGSGAMAVFVTSRSQGSVGLPAGVDR